MLDTKEVKAKKIRSNEALDAFAAVAFVLIFVSGMYLWLDAMP